MFIWFRPYANNPLTLITYVLHPKHKYPSIPERLLWEFSIYLHNSAGDECTRFLACLSYGFDKPWNPGFCDENTRISTTRDVPELVCTCEFYHSDDIRLSHSSDVLLNQLQCANSPPANVIKELVDSNNSMHISLSELNATHRRSWIFVSSSVLGTMAGPSECQGIVVIVWEVQGST